MKNLGLEQYMKLDYAVKIEKDFENGEAYYIAYHPELPGCLSDGATPEEALANLKDAREDYIKALLKWGDDIPLPEALKEKRSRADLRVVASSGGWKQATLPLEYEAELKVIAATFASYSLSRTVSDTKTPDRAISVLVA